MHDAADFVVSRSDLRRTAEAAYRTLLEGRASPAAGHVIWP
jgi:hypothetical protein